MILVLLIVSFITDRGEGYSVFLLAKAVQYFISPKKFFKVESGLGLPGCHRNNVEKKQCNA